MSTVFAHKTELLEPCRRDDGEADTGGKRVIPHPRKDIEMATLTDIEAWIEADTEMPIKILTGNNITVVMVISGTSHHTTPMYLDPVMTTPKKGGGNVLNLFPSFHQCRRLMLY